MSATHHLSGRPGTPLYNRCSSRGQKESTLESMSSPIKWWIYPQLKSIIHINLPLPLRLWIPHISSSKVTPCSAPQLWVCHCTCACALCLLSSAGTGQFNPHISWLLERLGFKHAQTTIPKWIQRVAMDPLDMVVANAMELLIKITATKKLQQKSRASSPPSH